MKKVDFLCPTILVFVILISWECVFAENWPGWRGDGRGISTEKNLPLKWSEQENVKWKTPIPGAGHSSPIVWGTRVFVTTAVAEDPNVETFRGGVYMGGDRAKPDASGYVYRLICLDAEKGNIRWSKTVIQQEPRTRRHTKNTYASETPATDGKYVFASFGSAGLYCVDFEGKVIWKQDLGLLRVRAGWGTGASPVLFRNTVIVNCDSDDDSYIAAFKKTTGEPVWRTERDESASWATPFLFEVGERTTVVTNARKRMRGYDAETGKLLWECAGGSMITVPSPVSSKGLVFLSSGHSMMFMRQPIIAVRSGASGDITPTGGKTQSQGVAWSHSRGGAYVTSPIAINEYLYVPLDKGTLTCYEAQTGKTVYEKQKLGKRNTITASPVYADGRIYIQTEDGECYVLKIGTTFEILAVNKLEEVFCASPAISGGKIFLRGRKHLYCIGK
ncbi:MAG: PQQ-binding-like beta-propeller repeat protein [candidate division Zixibacteria bacterium]|nr:PQQ-binding-like beta-propeller repeat protein [Phycisphaerae bacterium]NIR64404.1 PQQ-binding-like beta-propeller repeat protein [candidate division Zixibacteria bacterium]NIP53595.1 PQQ-binding-like beta-propeller repeat protein [Phycisphaerae bacterium]NIS52553.1 PQQ-binding-like beta-propeller repeat protein [Phycisphaerae bacterium]NIU14409.1 PQQ-binding-like beta-propeller repeat protein [candidate division Zixibacteria bacterium]